jgi:tRNA(Ile)-lysidine synthase
MRRERPLVESIRLARPLLCVSKSDLVAYCEHYALPFVSDPSNADDRFTRARLRRLMPKLAAEGLKASRLNRLAERLARDEAALSRLASSLVDTARRPSETSAFALDGRVLLDAPQALTLRALDLVLESVQSEPHRGAPRRLERLERLCLDALLPALAAETRMRRTLRGAIVEVTAKGLVIVAPAPPRRSSRSAEPCSRVADASDLLGKEEGAAYIGEACPE